ncbi:MAG: hypothetical protein DI538_18575 [Azospira oryzae]|jgi:hypothetical protein|nr:MAG: hypothetical protein DI538_18575 [Azospira oryzae]
MELQLKIIGALLIVLALIHVFFPTYFQWKKELQSISLINQQMMYVHTFFLAFALLLMGLLCITSATELIETPLGRKIGLGFSVFWSLRLVIQFFGYSSKLWRGKAFETTIHVIFSLLWIYLSVIFALVYLEY